MNRTIQVYVRHVYGVPTTYPACKLAQGLAGLAGTRTLTLQALRQIEAMGFAIEQVIDPATKVRR